MASTFDRANSLVLPASVLCFEQLVFPVQLITQVDQLVDLLCQSLQLLVRHGVLLVLGL